MKKTISMLLVLLCLMASVAMAAPDLPISKEPIELKAWVLDVNNTNRYSESALLDWLFEQTNVRLNVTTFSMSQQESLQLRFATLEDLPDIGLRLDMPASLLGDAAEGGFIVQLTDELLQEHAPYWAAFFQQYPLADKRVRGMRVGLPNCDYVEYVGNLRDLLLINKVWLDELKLETPTTTDEFTAVLQAFKDNAGKGAIPPEASPFYYQWDHRISGMFDVLGFWGVTVTQTNWLAIDDGKVVFQGVNPQIIEPLKYLAQLYKLGLTPAESFTDDRNMSIARTTSKTPYLGFFTAYSNALPEVYVPMAPVNPGTGVQPVIRKQEFTTTGTNDYIIFSGNPHLAESLRLIDWMASSQEATANFQMGMQGYFWEYDADGKVTPMDTKLYTDAQLEEYGKKYGSFGNFIAGIRADDFYANYNDITYDDPTSRAWAYTNLYLPYVPEGQTNYISESTGDTKLDQRRSDLQTEIDSLRSTTLARWITGQGDIDAEWDAYVAKVNALGLEEYLSLCQKGYDNLGL